MAGLLNGKQSMCRVVLRTLVVTLLAYFCVGLGTTTAADRKADAVKDFPKYSVFSKGIEKYFGQKRGYRDGDIISQSEVREVFRKLKSMGWVVTDQKEILAQVLPDNDYMVRQLRTKKGRVFMADLSKTPAAYDRLERFLRLPLSKREFRGLLNGPDGYKMFSYMVTSRGGKALGRQLSNIKQGRNFNKPTGHIYTVDQLVKRLSESYANYVLGLKTAATKK